MKKHDLLFYNEYEKFYHMASKSELFREYCTRVFGRDFSQDGFSDVSQIDDILNLIELKENQIILDIGCGNGKMLEYIHEKTGAITYGFDYSENAIASATQRVGVDNNAFHFEVGQIGEKQYDHNKFDVITSIDSIYFTQDMSAFVKQIMGWLKLEGYFVCAYQEGDLKKKSESMYQTELALVLRKLGIPYKVLDYTRKTYDLLRHKRTVAESMKQDFMKDGLRGWYEAAIYQSIDSGMSYEEFAQENSRYIYIIQK